MCQQLLYCLQWNCQALFQKQTRGKAAKHGIICHCSVLACIKKDQLSHHTYASINTEDPENRHSFLIS